MKDLFESLGIQSRAVAWTVIYVFLMWVILYFLFNFNIFSVAHWVRLTRVELHGFPGLVFGLMILSAVPLYIATTILTVRNKSMPIKIPLPNCLTPVPEKKEEMAPQPIVVEQEPLPELRPDVPIEMRESFMRAQKNYGARQMSVFNKPMTMDAVGVSRAPVRTPEPVTVPSNIEVADNGFPIPTDFDAVDDDVAKYGVPVFSDINFDNENNKDDSETVSPIDSLVEFLSGAGCAPNKTDDDLINVGNCIIATHDDDDFWVADDVDWFAAGRQKPSPIVALKNACAENTDLHPILYLGQYSIMDFDDVSEKWQADGITVVTSRDELLNTIKKFSE